MRSLTLSLVVAALAAVPLVMPTAALAASPVAALYGTVAAIDDADDAIPSVDQVNAALVFLGAPPVNELDVLPSQPLADWFDEGSRFVIAPAGGVGQVTITTGAWIAEDGDDEHQDFVDAVDKLRAYGQTRLAAEFMPLDPAVAFGANEALDAVTGSAEPGRPKSITLYRLARFSKAITLTSVEIEAVGDTIPDSDTVLASRILEVISKVVADNAR